MVVHTVKVCKEVDHIVLHGIDLPIALELEVGQIWCIEIDANNGAGIQPHVVPFVPLPPGVGDLMGRLIRARAHSSSIRTTRWGREIVGGIAMAG